MENIGEGLLHACISSLVTCNACKMQYVGFTITSFRLRFNNHKSSLNRYGQGIRNFSGQHLYEHFYEGHSDLSDFRVQILDSIDVINPWYKVSLHFVRDAHKILC